MTRTNPPTKLDERRVRRLLVLFFVALSVPALMLVRQAYSQLNWHAFRQTQLLAEELVSRIDADFAALMGIEEARSFGDYSFLIVEGDPQAGFVQRSPLSALPVESAIPGVLGYFQMNADGELTTPLLPPADVDAQAYGIAPAERARRAALEARIRDVLARNGLVPGSRAAAASRRDASPPEGSAQPDDAARRTDDEDAFGGEDALGAARRVQRPSIAAESAAVEQAPIIGPPGDAQPAAQEAFDRLSRTPTVPAGRDERAAGGRPETLAELLTLVAERESRREQAVVPEPSSEPMLEAWADERPSAGGPLRVSTFTSEIDPFELSLLDSGHLLMFRKVWREGRRHIQGAVIEQQPFLAATIERGFRTSSLARTADLLVAYDRRELGAFRPLHADGAAFAAASEPLYQARLSPPLGAFELVFMLRELPRGPGGLLLGWVTITLVAVLVVGFWLMYRFALGQIRLARQQQDFVSAVSHELKTPLTSIRMYGEMLQAGWADEARRKTYYEYIQAESERLSRLIDNVLQLARMTRKELRIDRESVPVAELLDLARSKVGSQVERAGFELVMVTDPACERSHVLADRDAFAQILINLVDNALKFSAGAPRKVVEIGCRPERGGTIVFTVRDHGPGVPRAQMKRIFELFYRADEALTRGTAGTGIGLALVRQLAAAMGARVDVRNREPGAEFSVSFPAVLRQDATTRSPARRLANDPS